MFDRLFGRRKPAYRVASLPYVLPALARIAEEAIVRGRYRIHAPQSDGSAILLLTIEPRLIAAVHTEPAGDDGLPVMVVEWVREADPDLDPFDLDGGAILPGG